MSKTKRRQQYAQIVAVITLLADAFPRAFSLYGARRQPLKIGIANDIAAKVDGAIQSEELRFALNNYCNSVGYLRSFKVGVARLDLNGDATRTITADEAEHARRKLVAKLMRLAAKRQPKPTPPPKSKPPAPEKPKRDGLADLRRAAKQRQSKITNQTTEQIR